MEIHPIEDVGSDICNDADDDISIMHHSRTTMPAASAIVDLARCPECESASEVIRNGRCTTCTG